jgi:hypothetical protein
MRFDFCANAPFDARRVRCQAKRFYVCAARRSKPCEGSEEDSIWEPEIADSRLHTKRKSPAMSYTLNPFFTTYSRSPRCSIPINYSFVTHHCSFVTLEI